MGFDSIGGNSQLVSNPLIAHTHTGIKIYLIHDFVCHGCLLSRECREEVAPPGWYMDYSSIFSTLMASERTSLPSRNS